MKTALADPEDDEPGRDKDWFTIHVAQYLSIGICRICHRTHEADTELGVVQKLTLCGLGHILAGRSFP